MEDILKKTLKWKAEEMSNDSEAEKETLKKTLKLEAEEMSNESVAVTKEDNETVTAASTSNISQIQQCTVLRD